MSFDATTIAAILAAFVAGFVRGFSGFGGALILMPVASAALSPQVAAPAFLVTDVLLTLPMTVRAIPHCRWPTVLPTAVGAMITAPFGAWLLAHEDPVTLRWAICAVVAVMLGLLVSGFRYRGEPGVPASLGVGGASGLLGGVAQVSGPPVIAFWVSGPLPAAIIRANMLCYFALISLTSFGAYLWNGLFNTGTVHAILVVAPAYALALFLGGRLFRQTGGAAYRPLAYAVIALSALTSMPIFDGILR